MLTLDELIDLAAAELLNAPGEGMRLSIPCALYIDAVSVADVRARLLDVFGDGEARTLNAEFGTVLYPGWASESPGVEDIGDDYKPA